MDNDTWEKGLPRIDDAEVANDAEDYENYEGYSHRKPTRRRQRDDHLEREFDEFGEDDIDVMHRRWRNRRRMAWVSLVSMLIATALILFTNLVSTEKLKILSEVITWFYLSCASIIGAYMGFTTWASKR